MVELRGKAPAKVNLVLEVLGRRRDGYHEIDTVLQTLELADEVRLGEGGGKVTLGGPFAGGVPDGGDNLVLRALEALRGQGVALPELDIDITKNIPAAGGLGGGASDAATALRLVGREFGANEEQVLAAAMAAGSDEAFFLVGGTARARGRGERVNPLADLPVHGVVLFIPPETIPEKTARMFRALGELPFEAGGVSAAFATHPPLRFGAADVYNVFERVAFDVFPGLAELQQDLERGLGEPVRLAGAGPTLFWVGEPEAAEEMAKRAAGATCTVVETRTAASLWRR